MNYALTGAVNRQKMRGPAIPIGIWPIMIAMPFMYWPKVLVGDTQPWVLIGAALSALFFWPRHHKPQISKLFYPIAAAVACIVAYVLRETDTQLILRYSGILVTFVLLWSIAMRGGQEQLGTAVRWSVVVWFLVGFYQVVGLRLGLPVEFFGRFVASRGGVPGLTAEPSFYGSISVIQAMLLLAERKPSNRPFITLAIISVFLSGSLLSYLLLIVPLMRLRSSVVVAGLALMLIVTTQGLRLSDSGLFNRISQFDLLSIADDPMAIVERDASTNLRFGHVVFTLYENLGRSLVFDSPISFRDSYNNWAYQEGRYIYNNSDFIVTSAGEMIFRSGIFGLVLISFVYLYAYRSAKEFKAKLEKCVFITLCFLSPIALSNPFLVFYIAQEE